MAYNPNQPRHPAGHPDGGQWTSDGAGGERHSSGAYYTKQRGRKFTTYDAQGKQTGVLSGVHPGVARFATLEDARTKTGVGDPASKRLQEGNAKRGALRTAAEDAAKLAYGDSWARMDAAAKRKAIKVESDHIKKKDAGYGYTIGDQAVRAGSSRASRDFVRRGIDIPPPRSRPDASLS